VITDIELDRALNALTVTMSDQRWDALDVRRAQGVVDGALGGERRLLVRETGEIASSGRNLVARLERSGDRWVARRELPAFGKLE